jgi:HPt (histidine-containing phosphotransfer) domain-containing protein
MTAGTPASPTNGPDVPSCLDEATVRSLLELEESEPGLLRELVETFRTDSPPRLDAIVEAARRGDGHDLMRAAHGLKSSAANMGARILAELCSDLETRGRGGALDGSVELAERAVDAYSSAADALDRFVS